MNHFIANHSSKLFVTRAQVFSLKINFNFESSFCNRLAFLNSNYTYDSNHKSFWKKFWESQTFEKIFVWNQYPLLGIIIISQVWTSAYSESGTDSRCRKVLGSKIIFLVNLSYWLQRCSVFQQRERVASVVHRQETVDCLKKFNARRKLKVIFPTVFSFELSDPF